MSREDMTVETTEHELRMTRAFNTKRERLFDAFSSCEQLSHWWGPRTWPMAECTMEFRVGGTWHFCLRGPNKNDVSWGKAFYREIVRPARLVYLDCFSDEEGNVNEKMPQVLIAYEFSEENGKAVLHATATYEEPSELEKVLKMGMVEGMTETLDRLEEHVTEA